MTMTMTRERFAPAPFTTTRLPPHVGAVLANLSVRLMHAMQLHAERRALRHLQRLDPHLLQDIGLEPSAMDALERSGHSLAAW